MSTHAWKIGQIVFVAEKRDRRRNNASWDPTPTEATIVKIGKKWATIKTRGNITERFSLLTGSIDQGEWGTGEGRVFAAPAEHAEWCDLHAAWDELKTETWSTHSPPSTLPSAAVREFVEALKCAKEAEVYDD